MKKCKSSTFGFLWLRYQGDRKQKIPKAFTRLKKIHVDHWLFSCERYYPNKGFYKK